MTMPIAPESLIKEQPLTDDNTFFSPAEECMGQTNVPDEGTCRKLLAFSAPQTIQGLFAPQWNLSGSNIAMPDAQSQDTPMDVGGILGGCAAYKIGGTYSSDVSYYPGRKGSFTAAHRSLPVGTKLKVTYTHPQSGKSVTATVTITDRGPNPNDQSRNAGKTAIQNRKLDLNDDVFDYFDRQLGLDNKNGRKKTRNLGIIQVQYTVLSVPKESTYKNGTYCNPIKS